MLDYQRPESKNVFSPDDKILDVPKSLATRYMLETGHAGVNTARGKKHRQSNCWGLMEERQRIHRNGGRDWVFTTHLVTVLGSCVFGYILFLGHPKYSPYWCTWSGHMFCLATYCMAYGYGMIRVSKNGYGLVCGDPEIFSEGAILWPGKSTTCHFWAWITYWCVLRREFSRMIHFITFVISSSQQPQQPIQQPYVKRTSEPPFSYGFPMVSYGFPMVWISRDIWTMADHGWGSRSAWVQGIDKNRRHSIDSTRPGKHT